MRTAEPRLYDSEMIVAWGALGLFLLATGAWGLSVLRRNANLVDELWGISQLVVVAVSLLAGETRTARSWLCAALVTAWGLRLSIHLVTRDRGRGEDFRHRQARERHGKSFVWRSLPEIFWFQLIGGGLVVGLPMFAVVSQPQPALGWVDGTAAALWIIGFSLETIADTQLRRFRANPANRARVLDQGLWRYSRHPNYFGEVMIWVGIALFGVAAGRWWSLFSPLMVFVITTRITGVATMDRHLKKTRGEEYARYVNTTSAFIPLPKRPSGN